MGKMFAYGTEVNSIFQLIGTLENDITKSIAWALCKCPVFLKNIIEEILKIDIDPSKVRIKYQDFEKGKGITDLEITDDEQFYIIIEAKRGWVLPSIEQLILYSDRKGLKDSCAENKAIVSMSECSATFAASYLRYTQVKGVPVKHLSWRRIYEIADKSRMGSGNVEKSLLGELMKYLGGLMTMQVKESNWVFIVSLSWTKPENCDLTWIDIVKKHNKYFHPLGGNGWPKEPPNYIAFRYNGMLQSIHHIEGYVVTKNLHDEVPEMPDRVENDNYFIYNLGPSIVLNKIVKTGKIYPSGRKWAMLDTLFTSDTIYEACEISKQRME